MVVTPTEQIEVTAKIVPVIPYHENETVRFELGRVTILLPGDDGDKRVVRGRDVDCIVDGERIRQGVGLVVINRVGPDGADQRLIGVVIRLKNDAGKEELKRLDTLEPGFLARVVVKDPDGAMLRDYPATGCRVLRHADVEWHDAYAWLDFIGVP